jgi:acyl-coenzyme A synthetase/AMP-(fatty) acid ligase/acyl carrier protein
MAGVGFDAFGWEVWPYLATGASIYIVDDEIRLDPCNLLHLINVNNITHSFISTALIPEFINISKHTNSSLKFLLTGGDKLSSLEKEGINYTVVNNYGPTEFTVVSTFYRLPEKDQITNPPIGKPIANAKIKIVNNQKVPVPIGVCGEIYIGGDSLARGYLNLNDLTAEKFIDFPLRNDDKKRMYKSGDMGRWLPDGNIEYMGRIDDQVKIRGYRIEPGEIENILLQSKLVDQVIVLPKDDGTGNNLLVAYVVVNSMFDKAEIITYLQNKLPRFMLPSLWVKMESFPLTHNGKIDKQALLLPNTSGLLSKEYIAPQTEIEITLAAIWEELLHLDKIGVHDDFFNIGGHSLLAKRMASYIERKLLVSVPMQVLFQSTTIKELSKYLEIHLNVYPPEQEKGYKFLNI